jgi:hypothetical protein
MVGSDLEMDGCRISPKQQGSLKTRLLVFDDVDLGKAVHHMPW